MKMAERSRQVLFLLLAMLALFQLTQGEFPDCNNPLGMENGDIPDSNLAATVSSYDNNPTMFGAHRARLNSPLGFRADPSALNSQDSFILVELPKEVIVTGVATQGLGEEWVTSYNMFATDDNGAYVYFRDVNTPVKEFKGNTDGDTVKFNTVPYPVKTSRVLLFPTRWHNNIALRFELYGCEPDNYFKIWLKLPNTTFMLSDMDLTDENTQYKKELVINEVKEYLKDVPGFLFAKLHQFSPPLFIYDLQIDQTSTTAEIEIHCIESTTQDIFRQLKGSLANQGGTPVFGNTILHFQHSSNVKCQPAMRISTNKDPFNAQPVGFNDSNYQDRLFIMTASLDPNCNITKTILYSWEIAFVDRETGVV